MTDKTPDSSRPKLSVWIRVDRLMRSIHLYTGLFLVPWMLVYAASAFFFNHGPALQKWLQIAPPKLELVRDVEFHPADAFSKKNLDEQASAIVQLVDLAGAHRVMVGQSNDRQLKILRLCGRGHYIIVWRRRENKIVVQQQQPFSYFRFINFLHTKGGYGLPYPAHLIWAAVVDLVAFTLAFWVISGIYIWARRPAKRMLGSFFLVTGLVLFTALAVALCF